MNGYIYVCIYTACQQEFFKYMYVCMKVVLYITNHTETPPENKIDDTQSKSSTNEKAEVKVPEVSSTKDAQKGFTHTYFVHTSCCFFNT